MELMAVKRDRELIQHGLQWEVEHAKVGGAVGHELPGAGTHKVLADRAETHKVLADRAGTHKVLPDIPRQVGSCTCHRCGNLYGPKSKKTGKKVFLSCRLLSVCQVCVPRHEAGCLTNKLRGCYSDSDKTCDCASGTEISHTGARGGHIDAQTSTAVLAAAPGNESSVPCQCLRCGNLFRPKSRKTGKVVVLHCKNECQVCRPYDRNDCVVHKFRGCYTKASLPCDCIRGQTIPWSTTPGSPGFIHNPAASKANYANYGMNKKDQIARTLSAEQKRPHHYCKVFVPTTRCGSNIQLTRSRLFYLWFPKNKTQRPHHCQSEVPLDIGGICRCEDGFERILGCGHGSQVKCEEMCRCSAHAENLATCPHLCQGQAELCNHTVTSKDYLLNLCERNKAVRSSCLDGPHAQQMNTTGLKVLRKPKCPEGYTINRTKFTPGQAGQWPPKLSINYQDSGNNPPTALPYSCVPADAIDITRGRQLLVDDYLISSMSSNVVRRFYKAEKVKEVLKPDRDWEVSKCVRWDYPAMLSNVKLYSGKVHYHNGNFIMLYLCGAVGECASHGRSGICYAESKDGSNWIKPNVTEDDIHPRHYPPNFESPLCKDNKATEMCARYKNMGNCKRKAEKQLREQQLCSKTCRTEECEERFGKHVPGTNIVLSYGIKSRHPMESISIFVGADDDPYKKFRMVVEDITGKTFNNGKSTDKGAPDNLRVWYSSNGKAWYGGYLIGRCHDRCSFIYDPFRRVWVDSIRLNVDSPINTGIPDKPKVVDHPRMRMYAERKHDLDRVTQGGSAYTQAANIDKWFVGDKVLPWVFCDVHDKYLWHHPTYKTDWWPHANPDIYFVDGTPYESLMTYFSTQSTSALMLQATRGVIKGAGFNHGGRLGIGQEMSIHQGFSRDGFHIQRAVPRIPIVRTDWPSNRVYIMGAQSLIVADNEVHYYFTSYTGYSKDFYYDGWDRPSTKSMLRSKTNKVCSVWLGRFRRDGFVSLQAHQAGVVTTERLTWQNSQGLRSYLFVNVYIAAEGVGSLCVEVLDADGAGIYPKSDCKDVTGGTVSTSTHNGTCQKVSWKRSDVLPEPGRQGLRLRFHLNNATLYSFWVSEGPEGTSNRFSWQSEQEAQCQSLRSAPAT